MSYSEIKLNEWLEGKPEIIQKLGREYKPWYIYKMRGGEKCQVVAYIEDGSVNVSVSQDLYEDSLEIIERVDPSTLTKIRGA